MDEPDESFETQLQLNLAAPYYCSKLFGKVMRSKRNGHIFNICSIASKEPVLNGGSYSVTKSALLCLNNVMRQELAGHNVKVTAVLPGQTITSSWEGTEIPENSFVKPSDIAEVVFSALNLSKGANIDEIIIRPVTF
ncbi:MAG: SDR family oxidoreductase, partial [Pedobacter sp.]